MEFIYYLLSGILDVITFIVIMMLMPFIKIINSEKINTFTEEILVKIFKEEGP